ncbi:MAG: cytochrome c [Anaerolineales bacterium]
MSRRLRRGLAFIALVLLPFIIGLLFTFEIVKIWFPTDMTEQPWTNFQEGPQILPPEGSVPIQGETIVLDVALTNPIPPDEVSLQRGELLYQFHCALCHGENGSGDGPLAEHYPERPPSDLTLPHVAGQFDSSLYRTIATGLGLMPGLSENLTPRERWDVINYLRTLEQTP